MDLEEFLSLKKKIDGLKSQIDRATGAKEQLLKRLKSEFKCDDLEDAERIYAKGQKELKGLEEDYNEQLEKLQEQDWYKELDK